MTSKQFWRPGFSAPGVGYNDTQDSDAQHGFDVGHAVAVPRSQTRMATTTTTMKEPEPRGSPDRPPVSVYKREILWALETCRVTLLVDDAGSGVPTQLPQYLLDAGWAAGGRGIMCASSRGSSAIALAQQVARQRNDTLNSPTCEIGYSVGLGSRVDANLTRIRFTTEGVLLRETLSDSLLSTTSVVVLLDAHERGLVTDTLLAVLKRILLKRTDLRLVVCLRSDGATVASLKALFANVITTTTSTTTTAPMTPSATTTTSMTTTASAIMSKTTKTKGACVVRVLPGWKGRGSAGTGTGARSAGAVCVAHARQPVRDITMASLDAVLQVLTATWCPPSTSLSASTAALGGGSISSIGVQQDVLVFLPNKETIVDLAEKLAEAIEAGVFYVSSPSYSTVSPSSSSSVGLPPTSTRARLDPGDVVIIPLHEHEDGLLAPNVRKALLDSPPLRASGQGLARRIIITTDKAIENLAIPTVGTVIDSGLVSLKVYCDIDALTLTSSSSTTPTTLPWQRPSSSVVGGAVMLERTVLSPISQRRAVARARRAGSSASTTLIDPSHPYPSSSPSYRREGSVSGLCLRLYPRSTFASLPRDDVLEVNRADLRASVLQLKALGVSDILHFDWPSPPSAFQLVRALASLHSLGAIDGTGALTPVGAAMAELPLEPNTARFVLAGVSNGCADSAVTIAALTSIQMSVFTHPHSGGDRAQQRRVGGGRGDRFVSSRSSSGGGSGEDHPSSLFAVHEGDHLTLLSVYRSFERERNMLMMQASQRSRRRPHRHDRNGSASQSRHKRHAAAAANAATVEGGTKEGEPFDVEAALRLLRRRVRMRNARAAVAAASGRTDAGRRATEEERLETRDYELAEDDDDIDGDDNDNDGEEEEYGDDYKDDGKRGEGRGRGNSNRHSNSKWVMDKLVHWCRKFGVSLEALLQATRVRARLHSILQTTVAAINVNVNVSVNVGTVRDQHTGGALVRQLLKSLVTGYSSNIAERVAVVDHLRSSSSRLGGTFLPLQLLTTPQSSRNDRPLFHVHSSSVVAGLASPKLVLYSVAFETTHIFMKHIAVIRDMALLAEGCPELFRVFNPKRPVL